VIEHLAAAAAALEEAARDSDDPSEALRGIVAALFAVLSAGPKSRGSSCARS